MNVQNGAAKERDTPDKKNKRVLKQQKAFVHLQCEHQRPKVAHGDCGLAREANQIVLAHRRKLCVVAARGRVLGVYGFNFRSVT